MSELGLCRLLPEADRDGCISVLQGGNKISHVGGSPSEPLGGKIAGIERSCRPGDGSSSLAQNT